MKKKGPARSVSMQMIEKLDAAMQEFVAGLAEDGGPEEILQVVIVIRARDSEPGEIYSAFGATGCNCKECTDGWISAVARKLGHNVTVVLGPSPEVVH